MLRRRKHWANIGTPVILRKMQLEAGILDSHLFLSGWLKKKKMERQQSLYWILRKTIGKYFRGSYNGFKIRSHVLRQPSLQKLEPNSPSPRVRQTYHSLLTPECSEVAMWLLKWGHERGCCLQPTLFDLPSLREVAHCVVRMLESTEHWHLCYGWIVPWPQNSSLKVPTPSISECGCIWRQDLWSRN